MHNKLNKFTLLKGNRGPGVPLLFSSGGYLVITGGQNYLN